MSSKIITYKAAQRMESTARIQAMKSEIEFLKPFKLRAKLDLEELTSRIDFLQGQIAAEQIAAPKK